VAAGKDVNRSAGMDPVQVEVTEFVEPTVQVGFQVRPQVIVPASTKHQFGNRLSTIFTGSALVELSGELQDVMNASTYDPWFDETRMPSGESLELQAVLNVVSAVLDGLVAGWTRPGALLGAGQGGFEVASALLGLFVSNQQPPSLELAQVDALFQKLINETQAKRARSHILGAAQWLDEYVVKSKGTIQNGHVGELSEEDRRRFLAEMSDYLEGRNPFKGAMDELTFNREWRFHAIPEYLLGIGIMLDLEKLDLMKRESSDTGVTIHDIENLVKHIDRYESALHQSEDDFVRNRAAFFSRYPILGPNELGLWDDPSAKPIGPVAEMKQAARGYITKFLKGDRYLVQSATGRLEAIKSALRNLSLR
jgi:hypothetical protein